MLQKIEKMGEGFQINIPSTMAQKCGISDNQEINIRISDHRIIIENTDSSFSSLMTNWHEEECHSEMFFG